MQKKIVSKENVVVDMSFWKYFKHLPICLQNFITIGFGRPMSFRLILLLNDQEFLCHWFYTNVR